MEKRRGGGRVKRALVSFDQLQKQEQRDSCSVWQGGKGTYVFENTGEVQVGRPIRKVYLNRTYFTGLFKSKRSGEFLGDIKEPEGKKYLVFRVKGDREIEILAKVSADGNGVAN